MLKNTLYLIATLAMLLLAGCSKYDDAAVRNDILDLQGRVSSLETICNQMNSNLSSLKSIVDAIQKGYFVADVQEVSDGYKITFSNQTTIVLFNGKNGADGKNGVTPSIGVAKNNDGIYYWTLDGTWLLDSAGKMIQASGVNGADGKDGQNGITPQLKIEDKNWYLSIDDGHTWSVLGKASGEDGETLFSSVSQDDDYVYLTLSGGEILKLQKESSFALSFAETDFHPATNHMDIPFSVISAQSDLKVIVISDKNIEATVAVNGIQSGTVSIDFLNGDYNGNIIVAAKSNGKTAMEFLCFEKGVLTTTSEKQFNVASAGEELSISVSHNMPMEVSTNVNWIERIDATKSTVTETLRFKVVENTSLDTRIGIITVKSTEDQSKIEFVVNQQGKQITDLVSAIYSGGSMMINGDLILYGSKLNFGVVNASDAEITVKSVQLIDGNTGTAGNIMSINAPIAAHSNAAWSITIGIAGIHNPTAKFVYVYNGAEYTTSAVYRELKL